MLLKQAQHSNHGLTTQALEEALQDRGLAHRLSQGAGTRPCPSLCGRCVCVGGVGGRVMGKG